MSRRAGAALVLALLAAGCGDGQQPATGAVERDGGLSVHPVLGTTADETDPDRDALDPDALDPVGGSSVRDPDGGAALVLGPAVLTRDDLARAAVEPSRPGGPADALTLEWTDDGAVRWAQLTGAAACAPQDDPARRIAVLLDGDVLTAPVVSPAVQCDVGIAGGTTQLLGPFASSDVAGVAARLQPGAG